MTLVVGSRPPSSSPPDPWAEGSPLPTGISLTSSDGGSSETADHRGVQPSLPAVSLPTASVLGETVFGLGTTTLGSCGGVQTALGGVILLGSETIGGCGGLRPFVSWGCVPMKRSQKDGRLATSKTGLDAVVDGSKTPTPTGCSVGAISKGRFTISSAMAGLLAEKAAPAKRIVEKTLRREETVEEIRLRCTTCSDRVRPRRSIGYSDFNIYSGRPIGPRSSKPSRTPAR